MKDTSKELQEVDQIIDMLEKTISDEEESFENELKENGFTNELPSILMELEDDEIKDLNFQEIDDILKEANCDPNCLKEAYYHSLDKSLSSLEFFVSVLLNIKQKATNIEDGKKNLESIKSDRLDISRSFLKMMKSPEYREARLKQLEYLKEQATTMEDPIEKKKIEKKLYHIERSQNFSFLNERLHKIGKKEVYSLEDSFFDRNRGSGIMERYYKILSRLKINTAIHRAFFNLEEKFLPEYYAPFNNFFLFHVIRFISHVDVNSEEDYLYMSSILGALRDLSSEEATEEEKETIISLMKDFYSFFDNDETIELFKKKNSNYKLHPDRIKAEEDAETRKRHVATEKIRMELGSLFNLNEFDVYTAPEYLKNLLKEKESMKEFIRQNSDTSNIPDSYTYEKIFDIYKELQESLSSEEESEDNTITDNNDINEDEGEENE